MIEILGLALAVLRPALVSSLLSTAVENRSSLHLLLSSWPVRGGRDILGLAIAVLGLARFCTSPSSGFHG